MAHCKELIVDRLVVEDPARRSRIEITGSSIQFFDRRKKLRALLELHQPWDDAPRLGFYGHKGQERLALTLEGSDSPVLHLHDGNGMDRVSLHIFDDGTPSIWTLRLPCTARRHFSRLFAPWAVLDLGKMTSSTSLTLPHWDKVSSRIN